jgi:hypothetical protein
LPASDRSCDAPNAMAALQPPLPRTAGAAPRRRLRELTRHVSAPACTDAAGLAAPPSTTLTLHLRSRHRVNPRPATPHGGLAAGGSAAAALTPPPEGSTTPPLRWAPREDRHEVAIAQTAIVLIDMWCAALTTSATLAGALPLVVRRLTRAG